MLATIAFALTTAAAQQIVRTHAVPSVDYYGYAMAAGDIDKDGVVDLVTGGWNAAAPTSAFAHVISGATGLEMISPASRGTSNPIPMRWYATSINSWMSRSIAVHPDINDDGYPDVVVGCPDIPPGGGVPWSGSIRIFSGQTGAELPGILNVQWKMLGLGAIKFVDADLDSVEDIVIGSTIPASGSVSVYSGNAARSFICDITASAVYDQFGFSIDVLSDMNGDTVPELVVSAVPAAVGRHGYLYIVSVGPSQRGQVLAHFPSTSAPASQGDYYGWSVMAVPDRDGDQKKDILVAVHYSNPPRIELISSALPSSGVPTVLWQQPPAGNPGPAIRLGGTLAKFIDINVDGVDDFLTGNRICSGANGGLLLELRPELIDPHPQAISQMGVSETSAGYLLLGDYTSDGVPELAVHNFFTADLVRVVSLGASATAYGMGCGNPPLTLTFGSIPRALGGSVQLDLRNGPSSGLALCLYGLAKQVPALPLGPIAPGCSLFVQAIDTSPITLIVGGPTTATWSFAWPAVPQAHGLEFHAQAVTLDGQQSLLLSNPGSFRVGL